MSQPPEDRMPEDQPPAAGRGFSLSARYDVRQTLGSRGCCSTYLAVDRQTRATVALKELAPPADRYEPLTAALRRAFDCLKPLQHERIPRFLGVHEYLADGERRVCLVQQYVKGKTIAQWVSEGRRFDERDGLSILSGVCDALAYLHGRAPAVLHGSIDPGHILLDAYDKPFLIDFGVAERVLEEAGVPTGAGGGPRSGFIAFEQLAGKPVPASDIYSLGMTVLFAMTGREPLDRAAAWEPPGDLGPPSDATRLLHRMLEPSWERRYSGGAELQRELRVLRRRSQPFSAADLVAVGAAIASWLWAAYSFLGVMPAAPGPKRPVASPSRVVAARTLPPPLFSYSQARQAVEALLETEAESGPIAWETIDGRFVLYFNGRQVNDEKRSYRRPDGTLVYLDSTGAGQLGRPGAWRRRLPSIAGRYCPITHVALDEYETVWAGGPCGLFRFTGSWTRITDREIVDRRVTALEVAPGGRVLVGTVLAAGAEGAGGLKSFDGRAWRALWGDDGARVNALLRSDGAWIAATDQGAFTERQGRPEKIAPSSAGYRTAHATFDGTLWLGRAQGGLDLTGKGRVVFLPFDWYPEAIASDGEHRLWVLDRAGAVRVYSAETLAGSAR